MVQRLISTNRTPQQRYVRQPPTNRVETFAYPGTPRVTYQLRSFPAIGLGILCDGDEAHVFYRTLVCWETLYGPAARAAYFWRTLPLPTRTVPGLPDWWIELCKTA